MQTLSKQEMVLAAGGMIAPLWGWGWGAWAWRRGSMVHSPISRRPAPNPPRPRPVPIFR